MGYEDAPATKMLATNCAICHRPLCDAVSVEIGIGPDCREKYGYNEGNSENREEANKAVHAIACDRSPGTVIPAVSTLKSLGFDRLAAVIEDRVASVKISPLGSLLAVRTPYSEAAVAALRTVPGRRWDKDHKVNTFPVTAKNQLWAVIKRCFPGELLVCGKGLIYIG